MDLLDQLLFLLIIKVHIPDTVGLRQGRKKEINSNQTLFKKKKKNSHPHIAKPSNINNKVKFTEQLVHLFILERHSPLGQSGFTGPVLDHDEANHPRSS